MKLVSILFANYIAFSALAGEMALQKEVKLRAMVGVAGVNIQGVMEEFKKQLQRRLPEVRMIVSPQESAAIIVAKMDLATKTDREALSLMRVLSLETANCPTTSTQAYNECVSFAMDSNRWNRVNYGDWLARARSEGAVGLFASRITMKIEPVTADQAELIMKFANEFEILYHSNPKALPMNMDGIAFEIK